MHTENTYTVYHSKTGIMLLKSEELHQCYITRNYKTNIGCLNQGLTIILKEIMTLRCRVERHNSICTKHKHTALTESHELSPYCHIVFVLKTSSVLERNVLYLWSVCWHTAVL